MAFWTEAFFSRTWSVVYNSTTCRIVMKPNKVINYIFGCTYCQNLCKFAVIYYWLKWQQTYMSKVLSLSPIKIVSNMNRMSTLIIKCTWFNRLIWATLRLTCSPQWTDILVAICFCKFIFLLFRLANKSCFTLIVWVL